MIRKTFDAFASHSLKTLALFAMPAALVAVPVMAQEAAAPTIVVVETPAPAVEPVDPTASPLTAQFMVDISKIDLDGSGSLDYGEARAVWTDLTEEQFVALDVSGDGFLDDNELAAAYEQNLLDFDEAPNVESATGGN